jgi:DNA-binding LacI/PurR family transcriptional regulator
MNADSKSQRKNSTPGIRDIAERCGVSVATVSRALRQDTTQQSAETIERVIRAANEMGYDPSRTRAARRLVLRHSEKPVVNHTIGLLFVHGATRLATYFIRLLEGVLMAAARTDFEVQITNAFHVETSGMLPMGYRSGEIDGVLVPGVCTSFSPLNEMLRSEPGFGKRPIVGMVQHLDGCSAVYADNFSVGWTTITHLLDLGHKHIVHFVNPNEPPHDAHALRLAAYEQAARNRGFDTDKALAYCPWRFGEAYVSESSERLVRFLKEHPNATAVIARNDPQALDIYNAVVSAGYRVPDDISIIGSDDTDPVIEDRTNILTTIRLPLVEVGERATEMLIQRVLGEEPDDRDICLPVELVVRKSTAPPRKLAK